MFVVALKVNFVFPGYFYIAVLPIFCWNVQFLSLPRHHRLKTPAGLDQFHFVVL